MKFYKSCNTLPIGRFFRIFETDDFKHLIIGYDFENDDLKLSADQIIQLANIFEDIYYEYSELSHNHKLRSTLKKQILIAEWELTYILVSNLIGIYRRHKDLEALILINNIDGFEIIIDVEKNVNQQLDKLEHRIKGLKNKIKIFKIKMVKSMENNKKDVKIDLDKDALYLERNLELKREVDPETATVSKWLKLIELSKERSKMLEQQKSRRNGTN